jgi:hypothetical protein
MSSIKGGEFFTSWASISFSLWILFHAVFKDVCGNFLKVRQYTEQKQKVQDDDNIEEWACHKECQVTGLYSQVDK